MGNRLQKQLPAVATSIGQILAVAKRLGGCSGRTRAAGSQECISLAAPFHFTVLCLPQAYPNPSSDSKGASSNPIVSATATASDRVAADSIAMRLCKSHWGCFCQA